MIELKNIWQILNVIKKWSILWNDYKPSSFSDLPK